MLNRIFKTFFGFKSNQIAFSNLVFHADSEYDIFKKFHTINDLEI